MRKTEQKRKASLKKSAENRIQKGETDTSEKISKREEKKCE